MANTELFVASPPCWRWLGWGECCRRGEDDVGVVQQPADVSVDDLATVAVIDTVKRQETRQRGPVRSRAFMAASWFECP